MGTIGTIGVNPLLMLNPPYDPQRDFTPISTVADVPGVLVVNPQVPVHNVTELIAYAKQHPGQLNFGSPGNGSSPHIAGELFRQRAGIDIVHVPYAGASQVMIDVLSGRVQMFFDNIITSLPHIKSGKLRALAVTADHRSALLPNVPTVSESGLPGYAITGWMGLMAPAGLPAAITARLSEEVRKIAKLPEMPQEVVGADWTGSTPDEFARFIKAENDRWAAVIKAGNITRQ
jgi:tripartite-type tricarboxylate transporter receptor subunit TctC